MTTHPPPRPTYHRLPWYLNDAPDMPQSRLMGGPAARELEAAKSAAHVTNSINRREDSDRETRSHAVAAAIELLALMPYQPLDKNLVEFQREVLLVADVLAHYVASGIVPPMPPPAGATPLQTEHARSMYPSNPGQPWPTGGSPLGGAAA